MSNKRDWWAIVCSVLAIAVIASMFCIAVYQFTVYVMDTGPTRYIAPIWSK